MKGEHKWKKEELVQEIPAFLSRSRACLMDGTHRYKRCGDDMNMALLNEVLKQVCENSYWMGYYENAPTDECKYYIALGFLLSQPDCNIDWDEVRNERKRLETSFEYLEWKHLYTYSGHNPLRSYYRNKMERSRNNTSSE